MERTTAIKKLSALLGKGFGYRINDRAPGPEAREAARAALPAAHAHRIALTTARDARREAILAADEDYQRLRGEAKAASDVVEKLSGITRHFKITVGNSNGIFFVVKAEGDSWEEIIAKVKK